MLQRHENIWYTKKEIQPVQCHIDMIIYECDTQSKKVEPVMLDTHVQCHIDMILYKWHKHESRTCNVGYLCAMSMYNIGLSHT